MCEVRKVRRTSGEKRLASRTERGDERRVLLELLEDIDRESAREQVQILGVRSEDGRELLEPLSRGHEIARLKLRDDGARHAQAACEVRLCEICVHPELVQGLTYHFVAFLFWKLLEGTRR